MVVIDLPFKRKWRAAESRLEIYCGSKPHQTQLTAGGWRLCQSISNVGENILL